MLAVFGKADERFGGGHARLAVVQYLTSDVAGYLQGTFVSDHDRRAMFSAAAELTYLAGWKAFDSSLDGVAQRYYLQLLRLANEADDRALAGFTLRAMAHQAVDLGHGPEALQLASSALEWSREGDPGGNRNFDRSHRSGTCRDEVQGPNVEQYATGSAATVPGPTPSSSTSCR